jgi:hypothetical protein
MRGIILQGRVPGIFSEDWDLEAQKSKARLYVLEHKNSCRYAKVIP